MSSLKEYIGPVARRTLEQRLEDHYKEPVTILAKYNIETDDTLVTLWFMRSDKLIDFHLSSLGYNLGCSMKKVVEEEKLVNYIINNF